MGEMASHDMDPDVVRWGLHLLDVCTLAHCGLPCIVTRYDPNFSRVEYVREGFCQPDYVENDEAVARAYQEELSRLDSMGASRKSNFENEEIQGSVYTQDWPHSSNGNYIFGRELQFCFSFLFCLSCFALLFCFVYLALLYFSFNSLSKLVMINCQQVGNEPCRNSVEESLYNMKEVDNYGLSEREHEVYGSSSGSGEIPATSDDVWHSLEISDESSLDGEVGKILNQMILIPHIPKTNEKIPSDDEEISDHQRLLDRLQLYDLIECKVQGDGNCQFHSLSDQLYRSPDHHKFVRDQIIQQLKSYPDLYAGYVPIAVVII